MCLTYTFRLDLQWWRDLLPVYNGRQLIQLERQCIPLHITIDESTIVIWAHDSKCTARIPESIATQDHRLAHRELYAILVASTIWHRSWTEKEVFIHCADPQKLNIIVHGRTRNMAVLAIARKIWLFAAQWDIKYTPTVQTDYIPVASTILKAPVISIK